VLLTSAAVSFFAPSLLANDLVPVSTKDKKVIRRWTLSGDPRGVAVGADGTVYVGLAETQSVVAIDPKTGAVKKHVVLDSAHIAATKELVTLRTNADRSRLYIANGTDESALILSLPDLAVLREITMEGERIRDVVPDPKGRYVYLLGRRVHVYDSEGDTELRTLPIEDPMTIASSSNGTSLAVFATEDFGTAKATAVTLFDTKSFAVIVREPMQTDKIIESATFAANDRSLVAFSRDQLFEKAVASRPRSKTRLDIGELVNTTRVCLPTDGGPQIATVAGADTLVVYAERRCSTSTAFPGSSRGVTPASLYGVSAYALTFDPTTGSLVATDRAGFLTIYNLPRPVVAR
jgi:hypothetical protein